MRGDTRVRFSATSRGFEGEIALARIAIAEELDRPYEIETALVLPGDADPRALLGKDFTIDMDRAGTARRWTGVVCEVRHGEEAGRRGVGLPVEATVVPALYFLSLRRTSRIFQEKTALEIARAVLEEGLAPFSRQVRIEARASYPKREYCVQYGETDLAFVERLLQEEGIAYSFDHEGEREVLVLTDDNKQFPRITSAAGDSRVHFGPEGLVLDEREVVHEFSRRTALTPTSIAVRDHDFTAPKSPAAEVQTADDRGRDRESYEHGLGRSLTIGDYAGRGYGAEDSKRQAALRREAQAMGASTILGEGRATSLAPGSRLTLVDHPGLGVDGEYVVTRIDHRGSDLGSEDTALATSGYTNRFECIPLAAAYRPARRAIKPSISGFETAIVTGPTGEEIHTDEHGRIKVQFHWDREGENDEKTTCFVRVRQTWAGAGWGFVFIPRIGMEVVVAFQDGDPDRPIVTGCVYNASHRPPYPLPDEKTKSTIKSQSSTGAPSGFNELRFEDRAGDEEIFTHAQKDQNEVVLASHSTSVGGNQRNIVAAKQTQKVHVDQIENVKGDQTMKVGGDRTVHVGGSFTEKVTGGESRKVGGLVKEIIAGFEHRTVTGGAQNVINGGENRLVLTGMKEEITGPHEQTVDGDNTEILTAGSKQTITAGPVNYNTAGTFKLKAGGPIALNGLAGVKYVSTVVEHTVTVDFHFDPIYPSVKGVYAKNAANFIELYAAKGAAYVSTSSHGPAKAAFFGNFYGFYQCKVAAAGLKLDLYGKDDSETGVSMAPMEFKFSA